uniref:Odorant receptor n=1 Tax=Aulacocentrum confusum TaxID=2767324 RepID=A0A7G8Z968_9HYME|nr:olfactory receptor 49 [Aulacocentrum confusum]
MMETGEIAFFMLKLAAVWRPLNWSSWKAWLYNFSTAVVFFIMSFTVISLIIPLMMSLDIETIFEGRMLEFAMVLAMCKGGVFVINRREVLNLNNILNGALCYPRVEEEWKIRHEILQPFKKYAAFLALGTHFVIKLDVIASILENAPKQRLKFNAWLPFDYTSGPGYWIPFIFQHMSMIYACFYDVYHDTVIFDYLYQICVQIAILKYRIQKYFIFWDKIFVQIGDEKTSGSQIFADHMEHYLCIIDFAEKLNNTFLYTIFMQFTLSTMIVCYEIYSLTTVSPTSSEFLIIISYTILFLMQIFCYCVIGDMVLQRSGEISSSIYQLDWTLLSPKFQKNLILMLCRMSRPIQITSGHIIVLSHQTFASLLKLAYSIYNLLKK